VSVRSDQVIEFVKNAVDDLDKQVALLGLGGCHKEGQDVVEELAGSKLPCVDGNLSQGTLPHLRVAILDL
jgi:hypothetical protein